MVSVVISVEQTSLDNRAKLMDVKELKDTCKELDNTLDLLQQQADVRLIELRGLLGSLEYLLLRGSEGLKNGVCRVIYGQRGHLCLASPIFRWPELLDQGARVMVMMMCATEQFHQSVEARENCTSTRR